MMSFTNHFVIPNYDVIPSNQIYWPSCGTPGDSTELVSMPWVRLRKETVKVSIKMAEPSALWASAWKTIKYRKASKEALPLRGQSVAGWTRWPK